jgi:hypothetical protein
VGEQTAVSTGVSRDRSTRFDICGLLQILVNTGRNGKSCAAAAAAAGGGRISRFVLSAFVSLCRADCDLF